MLDKNWTEWKKNTKKIVEVSRRDTTRTKLPKWSSMFKHTLLDEIGGGGRCRSTLTNLLHNRTRYSKFFDNFLSHLFVCLHFVSLRFMVDYRCTTQRWCRKLSHWDLDYVPQCVCHSLVSFEFRFTHKYAGIRCRLYLSKYDDRNDDFRYSFFCILLLLRLLFAFFQIV